MSRAGIVLLDRDGVINALVPDPRSGNPESPLDARDVRILPGVPEALTALRRAGWRLAGISNQPAAAKGTIGLSELLAINARVLELLEARGVTFDDFRLCLHHPDAVVAELRGPCACRKPAPGLLVAALEALDAAAGASWMVGDTDADILAGRAAGCQTILIETPESAHKRGGHLGDTPRAADLTEAIAVISQGSDA